MSNGNSRHNEIASTLRTEILRNQYRVGERLPSERDLSARFNTNRGTVREALVQLQQLGIISIQPGGVRVLAREQASLEILGHLLKLNESPDPKLVDQFLEVFQAICVMSAETCITQADEEQLKLLGDRVAELKRNVGNREALRLSWTGLFEYFFTINDNMVMRLVAKSLREQLIEPMSSQEFNRQIDGQEMASIIENLNHSVIKRDAKMMGCAISRYFESVRKMTGMALSYVEPLRQNYS